MNLLEDPYIGLYFYSAVFQGNMALLALVGVFTVFRIQIIENRLLGLENQLSEFIRDYVHRFMDGEERYLDFSNIDSLKMEVENLQFKYPKQQTFTDFAKHLLKLPYYQRGFDQLTRFREALIGVRRGVTLPFVSSVGVIVLSLVMLPLSHSIHLHSIYLIEMSLIGITVMLNLIALFLNARFVFSTLSS